MYGLLIQQRFEFYDLFLDIHTMLILFSRFVNMFTSRKKIHKDKDAEPTEFEESVAQVSLWCCLLCLSVVQLLFITVSYDQELLPKHVIISAGDI